MNYLLAAGLGVIGLNVVVLVVALAHYLRSGRAAGHEGDAMPFNPATQSNGGRVEPD